MVCIIICTKEQNLVNRKCGSREEVWKYSVRAKVAGGLTSEDVKDRPFQTKGIAVLTNLYLSSRGEVAETDDR